MRAAEECCIEVGEVTPQLLGTTAKCQHWPGQYWKCDVRNGNCTDPGIRISGVPHSRVRAGAHLGDDRRLPRRSAGDADLTSGRCRQAGVVVETELQACLAEPREAVWLFFGQLPAGDTVGLRVPDDRA